MSVLSNLLENALEASLRTAPARRKIKLTAYLHSGSLALIQVENTYDGVIREKGGVFQSSKRKERRRASVRRHRRKIMGEYVYLSGRSVFIIRVMLMDNYALPFQNGTATDFSSLASGDP